MNILDRLNIFKRLKRLEEQEELFFSSVDELLTGLEMVLDDIDSRSNKLELLNKRLRQIAMSQTGSLDMLPDLDLEVG